MANAKNEVDDWYEKYRKQQEEYQKNAIEYLREFAARLKPFKIKKLYAQYNGSGDSGDFEELGIEFEDDADAGTAGNTLEHVLRALNMDEDSLKDKLWPLLPAGWEINEGSYGELTLDVATGQIRRVHNERIEEINTTEDEL